VIARAEACDRADLGWEKCDRVGLGMRLRYFWQRRSPRNWAWVEECDRPSLFIFRAAIAFFSAAIVLVPSRHAIALQAWMNWEAVLGGGRPAIVFVSWL
jgi:hypothetical protein